MKQFYKKVSKLIVNLLTLIFKYELFVVQTRLNLANAHN